MRRRTSSLVGASSDMASTSTSKKSDEIYSAVGRALTIFSGIENEVCTLFTIAVRNSHSNQAAAAYWAVTSFDARLRMVSAALRVSLKGDHLTFKKWNTVVVPNLSSLNAIRNKLAHGTVVGFRYSTLKNPELRNGTYFCPYYWGRSSVSGAVLPQQHPVTEVVWHDPRPTERLEAHQIIRHAEDFLAAERRLANFCKNVHQAMRKPEFAVPPRAKPQRPKSGNPRGRSRSPKES